MRVKTGIEELDNKLGGGFYRGSTIVVSGPPAVGKTILGLQFLFNGATMYGEKGTYITLSEPVSKTTEFCERLNFYDNTLVEEGMITFKDLGPLMMRHKIDVRSVLHEIGLLMAVEDVRRHVDGAHESVFDLNMRPEQRGHFHRAGEIVEVERFGIDFRELLGFDQINDAADRAG